MIKLEYDEISPITNNLCVLVEASDTGLNSYICMESGFGTNDLLRIGSDDVNIYEERISQLMRDVKYIDETRGLIWYPSYIHVGSYVLYCIGSTIKDLAWEVAPIVSLSEEESKQYPVPGRENEYFTSRIDIGAAQFYIDFNTALTSLYSNVAAVYQKDLETQE